MLPIVFHQTKHMMPLRCEKQPMIHITCHHKCQLDLVDVMKIQKKLQCNI